MKVRNDRINFKAAHNRYLRLITGDDIKPLPVKKQSWNRLEIASVSLFIGLIIGLGSFWGIQTALSPESATNQLYEQTERKIKAINRASSVEMIQFRDNCFQLKTLRMPLSPECKEVLK